jgi:hypothetical protein
LRASLDFGSGLFVCLCRSVQVRFVADIYGSLPTSNLERLSIHVEQATLNPRGFGS